MSAPPQEQQKEKADSEVGEVREVEDAPPPAAVLKPVDESEEKQNIKNNIEQLEQVEKGKAHNNAEDIDAQLVGQPLMREFRIPLPVFKNGRIECNPITSLLAIAMLFSLCAWCMTDPPGAKEQLLSLRAGVTRYFTWFFIGSTPVMMIFMVYIYIFHGKQKLGPPDSKPEFDAFSYFAMIFSAGVAVGLFFFGVSEPLYHLSDNRFDTGYHAMDERKNYAILQTIYHWGLSAWIGYVLVGITAGIVAYRDGYPMTMRSCFYPMLGAYTWGILGDIIDAFSIVVVISGVCTSLGLGAIQLVDGINRQANLGLVNDSDEENKVRIITIWIVTFIATASVVSGLNFGIKVLSQLALFLGLLLWFLVLMFDETSYLLNVIVSSIGNYFQYALLELNFETDAFAQLTKGNGDSVDGRGAYPAFMDDWTIFYWAWWTAWASFVGLFIARVSKGRTIREVIHFTLAGPLLYTFLWFSVFGGAGIRMYSRALELIELGTELGDPRMFKIDLGAGENDTETCYSFQQGANFIPEGYLEQNGWEFVDLSVGPLCTDIGDLSWWHTLEQYYEFGSFLSWLSLAALAIYFVTSSDSGSLIVDHLASNGAEDHFWLQRVFWAFMEGATATALLVAGKADALGALQAASILCGLPFKALLCILCASLYRLCNNYIGTEHRQFVMPVYAGVFGLLELLAAGLSGGQLINERPSAEMLYEAVLGVVAPWRGLYIATKQTKMCVLVGVFHALTIVLFFVTIGVEGAQGFAWAAYIGLTSVMAKLRNEFRTQQGIYGNFAEDFFCCLFLWFQVSAQMVVEINHGPMIEGIEEGMEDGDTVI